MRDKWHLAAPFPSFSSKINPGFSLPLFLTIFLCFMFRVPLQPSLVLSCPWMKQQDADCCKAAWFALSALSSLFWPGNSRWAKTTSSGAHLPPLWAHSHPSAWFKVFWSKPFVIKRSNIYSKHRWLLPCGSVQLSWITPRAADEGKAFM